MANKAKIDELNEIFSEAEQCDNDIFPEQRSNILLISGEHYAKIAKEIQNRLRTRSDVPEDTKVRLTKNHVQKIAKIYVNHIVSAAPGVQITPDNEKELKDKKAAQLRESIWQHAKRKYRLREKVRSWAEDYIGIGEVFVKIFWDPMAGEFVGYDQAVSEDGEPQVDENGEMVASEKPVFSGDFKFETFHGFNVLRDPRAKDLSESAYLLLRQMMSTDDLKKRYAGDEEKLKFIQEEQDKTFFVFDGNKGAYKKSKGQCQLKELYYRPCPAYPQGYFYIYTESGILEQGELPFGIFPIVHAVCERIQTSARGRSPVKHMRPYQAEINRMGSKMAEHQITLGDDKIILQNGSKLSQGALYPGVRGLTVTGEKPTILSGRDGTQYLQPMLSTINELYDVMSVKEMDSDKINTQDAYTLLFRSASQKKNFSLYIERFEQFLIDICSTFMQLAPKYYADSTKIQMIGSNEFVNMAELESQQDLNYQIKIEPMAEDIETQLGRQLILAQALQYSAQQLGPNGVAKIVKNMPFGGLKDSFDDLTMDSDIADNVVLALDRGEMVKPSIDDNPVYMLKRLTKRMREPDFKLLPPEIQARYQGLRDAYTQIKAQEEARLMAAKSEYIPAGGAMVACDIYVQDPKNPMSQKRARIPYEALNWLIKQIELQGTSLADLESLNSGQQATIMEQAASAGQAAGRMQPTQPTRQPLSPQTANQGPSLLENAVQGPATA
jgi:hypothetical protein